MQTNQLHYLPFYFFTVILTTLPTSSKRSLLQLFRAKSSMHLHSLTRMSRARPSYTTRFKYRNHTGRRVQNKKLLITQNLPSALHFLPLIYELSLQLPVLYQPRPVFLLHCENPIFKITQNKNKIMTVYVLIFCFSF